MTKICHVMTKICHVTHLHSTTDTRIFLHECRSLAKAGYDTYLVAPGNSREDHGVHIIGCGESPATRWGRFGSFRRRVCKVARELDADIYHIHNPLLLPFALEMKRAGRHVIFDSHEDVPGQILDKTYLGPLFIRKIVSKIYRAYETYASRRIDSVIVTDIHGIRIFEGRAASVVYVDNFPDLEDIRFHDGDFREREPIVCYVGGITRIRGIAEMAKAMEGVDGKLIAAGSADAGLEKFSHGNVELIGKINRDEVNELYGKSVAGLCILHPVENYIEAHPIKVFEYMAAGLPVICSDFPVLKKFVEGSNAGICVPAFDVDAIRSAIVKLLNDRDLARRMGLNGRRAVEEKYLWQNEAAKLIGLYRKIEAQE